MDGRRPAPGTFATAFDEALTAVDMTLATLRHRLAERGHKVAASTLGYWRNGRRQPERADSLDAVAEIEAILRLRPGALTSAIGASRRSGPPVPTASVQDLPEMSPAMSEALALLDMDSLRPGHLEEALDITADIDASGEWTRMTSRSRLRATTDGVTRSTGFCLGDPGTTAADGITVAAGATLGRTVRFDEHGLLLAELLLERPLDVGDTAMVEYSFSFTDVTDRELGTYAANRMSNVSVWARFTADRTPRRAWRFTQRPGEDQDVTEFDASASRSLHHALRGFGPGLMGIRWEW
jgi:hypothetical protein